MEVRAWGALASAAGQGCFEEGSRVIPSCRVIPVPPGGGGADAGTGPSLRHWLEWCKWLPSLGTRHLGEVSGAQGRRWAKKCLGAGPQGAQQVRGACGAKMEINRRAPNIPPRGRWKFSRPQEESSASAGGPAGRPALKASFSWAKEGSHSEGAPECLQRGSRAVFNLCSAPLPH